MSLTQTQDVRRSYHIESSELADLHNFRAGNGASASMYFTSGVGGTDTTQELSRPQISQSIQLLHIWFSLNIILNTKEGCEYGCFSTWYACISCNCRGGSC